MSARAPETRVAGRAAFTLIELLVVIAIIAALASVVAPAVFRNVADARTTSARAQLEVLSLALQQYQLDTGDFPTSEQGLDALRRAPMAEDGGDVSGWRGPYLPKPVPLDPWGRRYIYRSPGEHDSLTFDLATLGKDGRDGGVGENFDVTSWGSTNGAQDTPAASSQLR